jgi:ferredoxin-NADP reductase
MAKLIAEMMIETATMELPDTKTIKLNWPDGYDLEFKTGQFITLYWPDTPNYKRAYSLSSCAQDRGFYEVTVKRDGKMGTRIVDWAKVGDRLGVLPPTGKFLPVWEPPGKHLICIAGGSGVTPFRGFVREATRRKLDTRITILYSVRTTNDIIFNNEFRQLEQENPNVKFHVTCTRLPDNDPWSGRRGRIDADWIKQHITDTANTFFYACGPTTLVEATEHLVVHEMGIPKAQMLLEKWG